MYDSEKIMVLCSIFASFISFKSCVVFLIEYINEEENLCENKLNSQCQCGKWGKIQVSHKGM
jgi:hypothetical protein